MGMRNKRDVWTIAPAQFREAHFATFPAKLITPCILAGSRPGDTVLDPFAGSGTVGMVCNWLGRNSTLIELNPEYVEIARRRVNYPEKKPKAPKKKPILDNGDLFDSPA